jgi:uncharacterized protein involved in exopolysaccharide biosynthesis
LPSLRLRDVAQAILRWPGVILLVVLGFVGPTLVFTLLQPNVYEASTRVHDRAKFCGPLGDRHPRSRIAPPAVTVPRKHTLEAMDAIDSPAIAEEVIKRLGLSGIEPGELLENLAVAKADVSGGSFTVVRLSYKDTNPQRAQRIASTVA